MRNLLVISDCGTNVPHLTDDFTVTALELNAPKSQRLTAVREAEVIVGEPALEELKEARQLKWLQMTWAGADRYLKGGFPENVKLTTASGAFGQTIAEHALAMLLALCRRLPAYCSWKDMGSEKQVYGSTALIFGCGDIGSQIAKRLKPFGVHTIGVCQNAKKARPDFDLLTTMNCAEAFFDKADFVLCALPHSAETEHYFGAERLSALRDDAVIINVGRGSLIDTVALSNLLARGKFFGVGLDVVEPEPLPEDHPLWNMPNVIITPHIAGVSFGHLASTEEKIWDICRDNITRYLKGEPLRNQVYLR